jgi:hypothetical protein
MEDLPRGASVRLFIFYNAGNYTLHSRIHPQPSWLLTSRALQVMAVLKGRRCASAFEPTPVPAAVVDEALAAATRAPVRPPHKSPPPPPYPIPHRHCAARAALQGDAPAVCVFGALGLGRQRAVAIPLARTRNARQSRRRAAPRADAPPGVGGGGGRLRSCRALLCLDLGKTLTLPLRCFGLL